MNYSKFLLSAILAILFSLSTFVLTPSESNAATQKVFMAPANYYQYVYIDGILWRLEFDDDGKLMSEVMIDHD